MAFHVGQKVVCVDDKPEPGKCWLFGDRPKLGAIYTVAAVGLTEFGRPGIQLVELRRPDRWGFLRTRFRPIVKRKTDISIFKAMLNPSLEDLAGHILNEVT